MSSEHLATTPHERGKPGKHDRGKLGDQRGHRCVEVERARAHEHEVNDHEQHEQAPPGVNCWHKVGGVRFTARRIKDGPDEAVLATFGGCVEAQRKARHAVRVVVVPTDERGRRQRRDVILVVEAIARFPRLLEGLQHDRRPASRVGHQSDAACVVHVRAMLVRDDHRPSHLDKPERRGEQVDRHDPRERLHRHRACCGDDELDVAQVVHHVVRAREGVVTEERVV
mmetsp:Transcript_18497/g.46481  ORF Transcript_18497/g.46481 Transcript_18497/m.46481 type:complete len:226 (+) Transcript_18497:238-915(+)